MRFSALASFAFTVVALSACAAADDSATGDTAASGAAGAQPVDISLTAHNNSGLSGQGTLTPQDGSVALAVHVMGAEGEFAGQVVHGTCATVAQSASVAEAGTVTLAPGAMLDHTATIDLPIDSLANGQHAIVFRRGAGGEVVACADIPARSM